MAPRPVTKLPAIVDRPASERVYWAKRLRQWLVGRSELTRRNYAADLTDFARWSGRGTVDVALAALFAGEPEDVALRVQGVTLEYLEDLQTRPVWASMAARQREEPPDRHGLAPATIGRRLAALRAVVQLAIDARFCPRDVTLPKAPKVETLRDTRGISRRDFLELLEVVDHTIDTAKPGSQQQQLAVRDRAILRLMHDCGLRRVEVHGLRIENLIRDERGMSARLRRKGDKKLRLWPIATVPAACIDAWLTVRGDPTQGPVFTARNGKAMTIKAFNPLIKKWGERAGIDLHPHKLRHTAVTTLGKKTNGNIVGMQAFAGHKDPNHTMAYIHNEGDEIRAAQELLGGESEDDGQ